MNKKTLSQAFVFLSLFFLCPLFVQAQRDLPFKISNATLYALEQNVNLEMTFTLNTNNFPSNESLILIPELKDKKNNKILLPCVILNGTKKQRLYEREQKWDREPNKDLYVKSTIEITPKYGNHIQRLYKHTFNQQEWMQGNLTLSLRSFSSRCANCTDELGTIKIGDVYLKANKTLRKTAATPKSQKHSVLVNFYQPKKQDKKTVTKIGYAHLSFQTGKTDIIEQYKNNADELQKIIQSIQQFKNTLGVQVQYVNLTGYASPDGLYETNNALSYGRVLALKDYLQNAKGISVQMRTNYIAEDWKGLEKLIGNSSMPQKILALNIISRKEDPDKKEAELIRILDSKTYNTYFINHFYPKLRRVYFESSYKVGTYDLIQSSKLIKSKPELLSAKECYNVALSYGYGTQMFRQILINSSDHLMQNPQEVEAHINKAAALLVENRLQEAEQILLNYTNNAMAFNNLGVMYMMKGDFPKANTYFIRAEQYGKKEATKNLQLLHSIQ